MQYLLLPDTGDNSLTECTFVAIKIKNRDLVFTTFDERLFAVMAVGIIPGVSWDISDIFIMNIFLKGNFSKTFQCG